MPSTFTNTSYPLLQIGHLRLIETMPQSDTTTVPDYLIELWNLNLNHRPNTYSPLIIPLIRISIAYQRILNNGQHIQILRKLISIVGTPKLTVSIKLEVVQYLRHVAVKYFTVEYQNEILKSIRQLFQKNLFIDPDPIVRNAAFIAYAGVMGAVQHDVIQPDHITDDTNVRKQKRSTVSRDEQMKFLQELCTHSIQHECTDDKTSSLPTNDGSLDGRNAANEVLMKEIIDRMRRDARELMELNQVIRLKDTFCKDISSIQQDLASLK